jgi:hypothetical protein
MEPTDWVPVPETSSGDADVVKLYFFVTDGEAY